MHVAIVTTSYPLSPGSTSGIFVSRLVRQLPATIRKTVITPCPDHAATARDEQDIRIQCFRYAPTAWQRLAHRPGGIPAAFHNCRWLLLLLPGMLLAMLIACIRTGRKSDLIHANWSLNGFIAGIAGKLTATPVMTTLRGSDVERLEQSRLQRLVLYACLRLNHRIVTVSEAIRDDVCRRYPRFRARITSIPNGVGNDFLDIPLDRPRETDSFRITAIGNLSANKRIDTIIRAASRSACSRMLRLNIVGSGPEFDSLRTCARDATANGVEVEFSGSITPDGIPAVLAATDVFVLASRSEGRPNVVLEAMAAGLPVLAADIAGVRELIRHEETGLLFAGGDEHALAAQLDRLLNDVTLRQRLGRAARAFIHDNALTWEQCAASYTALYHECTRQQVP